MQLADSVYLQLYSCSLLTWTKYVVSGSRSGIRKTCWSPGTSCLNSRIEDSAVDCECEELRGFFIQNNCSETITNCVRPVAITSIFRAIFNRNRIFLDEGGRCPGQMSLGGQMCGPGQVSFLQLFAWLTDYIALQFYKSFYFSKISLTLLLKATF